MAQVPANISDITQALAQLLQLNVSRIAGASINPFSVSKLPPEKAEEAGDTRLNIHLYHVSQNNDGGPDLPIGGSPRNPIATRPMPIKLFYVLTAHAMINDTTDDVTSQHALMGWALKTLHDYGEVFEDTAVDGTQIFDSSITLDGRGIEIIIRPLEPEDSISFWSTDQVRTARLAAFLELRTLLLPPEPRRQASGLVGDLALGVFGGPAPRLERTASVMEFTLPPTAGGSVSRVPREPAVAVLHSTAGKPDARVQMFGAALNDEGRASRLVLRGDPLPGPAVIEVADNPSWNIDFGSSQALLEVRPSVVAKVGDTVAPLNLVPGLYSLSVIRERKLATESGATRPAAMESNRLPLALAPAIKLVQPRSLPNPERIKIVVDPAFDVSAAGMDAQVSIGADAYQKVDSFANNIAKDKGTFEASTSSSYEVSSASGAPLGSGTYPVRLSVNGIDAPPYWLEIP